MVVLFYVQAASVIVEEVCFHDPKESSPFLDAKANDWMSDVMTAEVQGQSVQALS